MKNFLINKTLFIEKYIKKCKTGQNVKKPLPAGPTLAHCLRFSREPFL
jgi:hypothetical protein